MEESVVRATGVQNAVRIERIIELIAEAGWTPAQRDTQYRIIRRFDGAPTVVTAR